VTRHAAASAPSVGDVQWVLWAGTVGLESALDLRFEAAASNRYSHVSLSALDVSRGAGEGLTAFDIKRRAEDAGLSLIVDPVMNWHPVSVPTRQSRFGRFSLDDNLRMVEALGAVSLTAIAAATDDSSPAQFVEPFATLCDRAGEFGGRVHLEFIPMTPISDIATAWRIVRDADRPNGGILLDSWHFFRGSASFADLESVPGERVFAIQIDDAHQNASPDLWNETQHRLLPGDGDFDLAQLIGVLARKNALRLIGPEVISPDTARMAPSEAARIGRERIEQLIAHAL
jgi:sugar phosphate isomerase/epimerase